MKRTDALHLRLDPETKAAWQQAADAVGKTLTRWLSDLASQALVAQPKPPIPWETVARNRREALAAREKRNV